VGFFFELFMKINFEHQNILITGGAGGIGEATVRYFHEANANIFLHFHSNQKNAESIKESLKTRIELIQCNLSDESDVEKMFSKLPQLHHVVANAGKYEREASPIDQMTMNQWKSTINNNLTSTFLTARGFFRNIKHYKTKSPSLVMIGSTAGIFGERDHCDYAAAKAALMNGLLPTLKNEITRIAPLGRVNVVAPGWTKTPMAKKHLEEAATVKKTLQTFPMQKVATPEDVAGAVLFLCSHLATHTTGEILRVTGGMEGRVLWDQDEIIIS
jgi:3-oxoacyl-[acyl-carrier protein] reductase